MHLEQCCFISEHQLQSVHSGCYNNMETVKISTMKEQQSGYVDLVLAPVINLTFSLNKVFCVACYLLVACITENSASFPPFLQPPKLTNTQGKRIFLLHSTVLPHYWYTGRANEDRHAVYGDNLFHLFNSELNFDAKNWSKALQRRYFRNKSHGDQSRQVTNLHPSVGTQQPITAK